MAPIPDPLRAALEGRYTIEGELGQGGMATVYLAEDLKHQRKVALKVLRPELTAVVGAERFLAEIRTTANLRHPHILPLFDSGDADGFLWYAMPYVEGESLRERLDREKQLPVDDAVSIAEKVAGALQAAHDAGIIHRDVKPANILLEKGEPVVADFGIALAVQEAGGGRLTETGLSLGTPYYMSPEQATGDRDPDARSDIYSVGCVLYEMLTGEPPFGGATAQAIVGRILTADPTPPTRARRSIPPNVEAAVLTALEKTPADRFASAAQFGAALRDETYRGAGGAAEPRSASRGPGSPSPTPWLAAAVAIALAFLGGWWIGGGSGPDSREVIRTTVLVGGEGLAEGPEANSGRPVTRTLVLSPDGRTLVFVGLRNGGPWLLRRPLGAEEAVPIEGTAGAQLPFFSPSGDEIGFWSDGRLWRVPLEGGTPAEIADHGTPRGGASWGDDDHIVFVENGLRRVPASGGTVERLPADPGAHLPHVLPGSDAILYTVRTGSPLEERRVEVFSRASGEVATLVENASDAHYLPTGHLVFARTGTLMTIPFDGETLEVTGGPTGVLPDVMHAMNGTSVGSWTDAAQFAVSQAGHLAYLEGGITPSNNRRIAWMDRSGGVTFPDSDERLYLSVRLAPDRAGTAATVIGVDPGIWVFDSDRGGAGRRVDDRMVPWVEWDPAGESLVYLAEDSIYRVRADGSGIPEVIAPINGYPFGWTPDRTEILYLVRATRGLGAIDVSTGQTRPLLEEPGGIRWPALSPDGRWLAYEVGEEIIVRSYPALEDRRVVARGLAPKWSRDGAELVFVRSTLGETTPTLFALRFDATIGRAVGEPLELFRRDDLTLTTPLRAYDVTPDGGRIVGILRASQPAPPKPDIHLVLNWFEELGGLGGG